ncbi:MAG: tetratricopeptide repeat protein [Tissierellia bacterium]|nr:tetratricopeptide repeat protein [Tissierellia bacterium]
MEIKKHQNYLIIANEFLSRDNYPRALIFFKKAYDFALTAKEKTDALYEMADIYLVLDQYRKAQTIYQKIIEINDQEPGAYYGLSLTNEFLEGNIEDSILNYKKAIAVDPNYDRAYYYLGHLYDKVGETEKAKKCFEECLKLDPYDYVTYNDLGAIYESENQLDMALELVAQSLTIHPNYGRALFNMGVIHKSRKDSNLALAYYTKAIGEFDSPYLFLNMSAIYIEQKQYHKAIEILNRGLEDFEDSVNLHYNKACCFNILGRKEEAIQELRQAILIEPNALSWAETDPDLKDITKEILW